MYSPRHNAERSRFGLWLVLALLGGSGPLVQAAGPEPAGWFAGDMHVHRSCGGAPEAVSDIYSEMSGQNLAVVSLLADMGNGEVQNPVTDLPLVNGQDDPVSTPGQIVHWDAEWHWDATYTQYAHQALGGHLVLLGLTNAYQIWAEYTYPIFQWAHQQGAIAGFAHMQYLGDDFPLTLTCCTPVEYPVEVALGSCDFVSEDVAGGDTAIHGYYRLLNCGFRPGFAGGSDHPCSSAVGQTLTYARISGGQLTYSNWIQSIARGRTVVSRNGHNEFLDLKVNGTAGPGDEIQLTNAGNVQVTVQWTAQESLSGTIELVKNGVVVASLPASAAPGAPASLNTNVSFTNSGWLCARRMDPVSGEHAIQASAVFITVNHAPVRASADDARFYMQWMNNLLALTSPGGGWSSFFVTNRTQAQARYSAALVVYQQIASEAAALLPVTIDTATLPYGTLNTAYSANLAAENGIPPYTWSRLGGSLPPGLTLDTNSGAVSGAPTAAGSFSFTIQVTDSSNPQETASKTLVATITTVPLVTLWPGSAVPNTIDQGFDNSLEVGVKLRSDVAGYVTAIRFYKASANTGTHIGNLWTSNGTLLASAPFTGETASGWQQVNFVNPVLISSNTVYVASYHCNNGHYSEDDGYFSSSGVDNPPLHALASGVSGPNGVSAYSSTNVFPTQAYDAANYWVDVVFCATNDIQMPVSIIVSPTNSTLTTGGAQQYTATGNYSNGSPQDITSQVTWSSTNSAVATVNGTGMVTAVTPGTTAINASLGGVSGSTLLRVLTGQLTIATTSLPSGIQNTTYATTLTANGGTMPYTWSIISSSLPGGLSLNTNSGTITGTPTGAGIFNFTVQVSDASQPVQTVTKPLSINILSLPNTVTIWSSNAMPGAVDAGADSSVELGVKFRSDLPGYITAVRFYKSTANTGTHLGDLWATNGTLLSSAAFTNETASGWQQINFVNPVSINSNTVYVASYHCNSGHYSEDDNFFSNSGVDNPPLHVLADGVSGPNGVYAYGAGSIFPDQSFSAANYWVDVVFVKPAPILTPPVIESLTLSNGVVTVNWCCVSNCTYRLQYNEDLDSSNWTDVLPAVQATGLTATASNVIGNASQRFYRVLLIP